MSGVIFEPDSLQFRGRILIVFCRRTGSPLVRTPSPRRRGPGGPHHPHHPHHDIGFSDTVSNVVEIVKEERGGVRGHRHYPHGRFPRGMPGRLCVLCSYYIDIDIFGVIFFWFWYFSNIYLCNTTSWHITHTEHI